MDATLQFIPILIVGFATSLGLTPLTRQIAMRLGVVDKPNQPRKTHKDHKPMMGGLAICLGLAISVLLFSHHYSQSVQNYVYSMVKLAGGRRWRDGAGTIVMRMQMMGLQRWA